MIQDQLAILVHNAITAAQQAGDFPPFEVPPPDGIPIERPRQAEHGDFATPVAMQLARPARRSPRQIAEALVKHLPVGDSNLLAGAEVAGPGFINFYLEPTWLARQVDRILAEGERYADLEIGGERKAQVEFVSANPTGPLTVGHGRGAVIGDTLGNILGAGGYNVTREYYFNDGGLQMKNLAESVRLRARQLLGEPVQFPENYYVGDYIVDIARALVAEYGPEVVNRDWTFFRDRAVEVIFADIRKTLERLGVRFDVYFNEMSFYDESQPGNVWDIVAALRERGLAYEAEGAVWFKATAFGAEKDRVLVRSTGEPTYRLPDVAYHANKLERGFDLIVNVLGADHIAQYPDIKAAVGALGYDAGKIHVVTNQFVTLVRNDEVVKMSTRRATYVTLDELIDEVGADAVRYFMISRSPESQFEFDLNLAREQSDENPVYYIQYAHARTAGILDRIAPERGIAFDPAAELTLLRHPAEAALIHEILRLKEILAFSIQRLEPHHLAHYAYDLAATFNVFYRDCRVLDPDNVPLSQARLKLVRAAQIALARALGLMGMSAPAEM
ncbi:MAG: arginine--tRNA ligase [Ardenticatenaceae bacterium]|nr:arginine--tRNA ligase [Ardenticatenaceae bacterium]HBY98282.1 arginine--tRNA ligase [Chloroflexota bacterium]